MSQENHGVTPSGSGLRPSGGAAEGASPAEPLVPNAWRVIDFVNAANPSEVERIYAAAHPSDPDLEDFAAYFTRFKAAINGCIGISRTDNMRAVLRHVRQEWSKHPGCGDDEEYIDVGGADDEADNWSLSFTPWGEWKLLPVEDRTGKNLSVDEIAAHLLYEITWYGSEEDAKEFHTELIDRVQEVKRSLASGIEARSDETPQAAQPEGREPGGNAATPETSQSEGPTS